jgi:hypothetical protein
LQAYIKNNYEKTIIVKRFKTYVYVSLGEVGFSSGNNHVPREKELKLSREQLKPFFFGEQSCPLRKRT